jgi:N-acyl-D-aspartate/D-glutamate deacylase
MTGLSAKRYGLPGRGEIKKGSYADIVIFDPSRINEQFTQQKSPAYSSGISHVFINGQTVLWEGTFREVLRPGRILRKV